MLEIPEEGEGYRGFVTGIGIPIPKEVLEAAAFDIPCSE